MFIFLGFKTWMEDRNTPMAVWKWILFALWILLFGFTIAFIFTSLGENERVAALKGGILFSLITIVSGVGLWRLLQLGRHKVSITPIPATADGSKTEKES